MQMIILNGIKILPLSNFKQTRERNAKYLHSLRRMDCLACGISPGGVAHHLLRAEKRGMGMKTGDNKAVPMCDNCHKELHHMGDEGLYWDLRGVDAYDWANKNWEKYHGVD